MCILKICRSLSLSIWYWTNVLAWQTCLYLLILFCSKSFSSKCNSIISKLKHSLHLSPLYPKISLLSIRAGLSYEPKKYYYYFLIPGQFIVVYFVGTYWIVDPVKLESLLFSQSDFKICRSKLSDISFE
jgi:hypothetical protein